MMFCTPPKGHGAMHPLWRSSAESCCLTLPKSSASCNSVMEGIMDFFRSMHSIFCLTWPVPCAHALIAACHPGQNSNSRNSGQVRPRQGTEICNFGAPSPLEALHWIFCFFSSIDVQFSKTSPLKSGERSEKSSGENRVKSCHVCGCHGFKIFRP